MKPLITILRDLFKNLFFFFTDPKTWEQIFSKRIEEETPVVPITPPPMEPTPTPQPVVHSIAWAGGTKEEHQAMYDLAMKVCAEEGLDKLPSRLLPHYTMRADVLATIFGESGFNQWCENPRTYDYSVCQFNVHTYLVEYKMTPQYAIDHPEECIRIMAKNFKAGRETNWVAYQGLQKMSKPALALHMQDIFSAFDKTA